MEEQGQQYLLKLEEACRVIHGQDPQLHVSDQERSAAETIIMNFRTTDEPYFLCRYFLDSTKNNFVLFETIVTLRTFLIRDWNKLIMSVKNELRWFLFQFVVNNDNLVGYVRESILQVIAMMVKRESVDDNFEESRNYLDEVEKLISDGDLTKQVLGCSMIAALMQEYSITVGSIDVGLTWEDHCYAKEEFETTDLIRIFAFSTEALSEITVLPRPFTQDVLIVPKRLLKICESVLVWMFISNNDLPRILVGEYEGKYNSKNNPSLTLGSEWKEIIADPNLVDLYFQMFLMVRDDSEFVHHCLNCLVQLSSIRGDIWNDLNEYMTYMENYIDNFLSIVSPDSIVASESIGIANIIRRIIAECTVEGFNELPRDLVKRFLKNTTLITCHLMKEASIEENLGVDDKMFLDAFNIILRPWENIMDNSNQCFPEAMCKSASIEIFNLYTKWRLSPPYGTKKLGANVDQHEDGNQIANVIIDSQLGYIVMFGRFVPEHTFTLLGTLLEGHIKEFQTIIEHVHSTGNSQWSQTFQEKVRSIHGDIHWLFHVAGLTLTSFKENPSDEDTISLSILYHCIKNSEKVNIGHSLKFLTNHMLGTDTPGSEESVGDIIKIVSFVLNFCELEKKLVEAKMECLYSPLLSSTLIWFLRKFSQMYLMPNEAFYDGLSIPFPEIFGQHTEPANWVINYLLNKVEFNIRSQLNRDTNLAEDTIELLVSLVQVKRKAEVVIKCEGFWKLFQLQDEHKNIMNSKVKEGLYKAFSLAADSLTDDDKKNEYWMQVLTPTLDTFRSIVTDTNFKTVVNEEIVQKTVTDILHKLIGVASGAVASTSHSIFNLLYPFFSDISSLIDHPNLVQLILKLFWEMVKNMVRFLQTEDRDKFFTSCYQMADMFASYKKRVAFNTDEDEQSFQDLYLFVDILKQLTSIEEDLSSDEEGTDTGKTAGDVCVYGLKAIFPLISESLLCFPTFCLRYFECVFFISERVTSKLCLIGPETFNGVLCTINCGLTAVYGPDISMSCIGFLGNVASYLLRQENRERMDAFMIMLQCLKYIMDLVLSSDLSYDAYDLSITSKALFSIASCFPDHFRELLKSLIADQDDELKAGRLQDAFNLLTDDIEFNGRDEMKRKFEHNFDTFVTDIQGFLYAMRIK